MATEPDIRRVPLMVDSSKREVIEAGLKVTQGKPIINSISMKEGEELFREHRPPGAQARRRGRSWRSTTRRARLDSLERRKVICERAYRILVDEVGFPAEDIIFDPNIFAATGIEEHAAYGTDYIEATR